ncbi:MAG TPA: type II secretion system major pseudopilin GspG [Acidobacteriota bacterium]|nr:type II secretion system major pseudopilin GspG [Acidobacteriota bacterium]
MKIRRRSRVLSFLIVGIIAVLAFLLFTPKLWTPGLRGKSQIAKIQIKEMEGALQLFRYDTARYPTTAEGLDALIINPGLTSWRGPYISRQEIPKDPWGRSFLYRCPGKPGMYDLLSYGRDGVPGGEGEDADIKGWEMSIPGR